MLGVLGFDRHLEDADAAVTGEGRLDPPSREGKLTGEVEPGAGRAGAGTAARDRRGSGIAGWSRTRARATRPRIRDGGRHPSSDIREAAAERIASVG